MPVISKNEAIRRGYPEGKFFIQTILIDKDVSKKNAIKWLKDHGYQYNDYRIAGEHRRFMQTNPIHGAQYYTKRLLFIDLVYQKF